MSNNFDQNLKHVLMVAYLYPPIENPGTKRTLKFIKYLPEFGYKSAVLTTRSRGQLPADAQTLTFRADDLFGAIKRPYRALKLRHVREEKRANIEILSSQNRLVQWQDAYFAPDIQITWYPLAVRQGLRVLRSHPIQVLYSTSSPETNHLVALRLKQKTGLPWVADFRDGWMFEPLRSIRLTSNYRRHIESRMERAVVLNADRVITVNDVIADDFAKRYPQAAAKLEVITNGYDPEDFAQLRRQRDGSNTFRIVHTGALSLSEGGRSINGMIEALQAMCQTDTVIMRHLEIVLVGNLSATEAEVIAQSGVGEHFVATGQIPYQQALQHQTDADVLLLVTAAAAKGVSTSKLYEYLATGRPILALSGPSPAAKLLTELEAGQVVEPDDVQGIQTALLTFYEQWQQGQLTTKRNEGVRQFDRRELTKKLAAIFDDLIGNDGR